jgi:hypothetical protein
VAPRGATEQGRAGVDVVVKSSILGIPGVA